MVKLGRLKIDGTKIKANANKHEAMSDGRMKQEEQRLKNDIAELLRKAESADMSKDAEHGADRTGTELLEALKRRERRLRALQAL